MNLLFELLLRYRNLLVFLLLETIALSLVVSNNRYQGAVGFTFMREFSGFVLNGYEAFTSYISLRDVNEKLAQENARLRELLINRRIPIPLKTDSITRRDYEFITAKVINNTLIYDKNYITIDKGANDGIEPGMGVITTDGVVGKVKSCSPNFSVLYSVLHSDIQVSSTIAKYKVTCFTKWTQQGYDEAEVLYIPRHIDVVVGDTVVTSGYNAIFPENYPVGYITDVQKSDADIHLKIRLKLSTDFTRLAHVYVMRGRKRAELETLQKQP